MNQLIKITLNVKGDYKLMDVKKDTQVQTTEEPTLPKRETIN